MNSRPRLFYMEKTPQTAYAVSIDISLWLGLETIQSVTVTAEDEDGVDKTSELVDTGKSTFIGGVIKPWIKGGVAGMSYLVTCLVTTTVTSTDIFCIRVVVRDVA